MDLIHVKVDIQAGHSFCASRCISDWSRMSKDRNLVLVVDDDPGMLKCVDRVLRLHAYEPILFSSAQAFNSHTDFDRAACIILDINLNDGSGIELRHRLKADEVSVPVIYMTGNENPGRSRNCAKLWMHRFSNEAILHAGADRAATQGGRAAVGFTRDSDVSLT